MYLQLPQPRRPSNPVRLLRCLIALGLVGGLAATAAEASPADPEAVAESPAEISLEVRVEGIDGDPEANVLSALSIRQFAEEGPLQPGWVRRLHNRAPREIGEALQPFGFYRAEIEAELLEEGDAWTAIYRVAPGEPIRVVELDLRLSGEGAETAPFLDARDSFPLAVGDVLLHAEYEAGKRLFTTPAARLGYFDARYETQLVEVDLESYTASVRLDYRTGPRYRFGEVEFVHDDLVEERLLQAAVDFAAGDPFDVAKLQSLQVALSDTSYFGGIEVETLMDEVHDLHVPIQVTMSAAKRGRYDFGVGYGTDTGVRGQIRWNLRRLNRKGHNASIWVRASERETSFNTRYRIPLPRPEIDRLEFVFGYGEHDTDTYKTLRGVGGVGTSRSRGRWHQIATLLLQTDDFTVGPDSGQPVHLVPGLSFETVRADDRIFPDLGYRIRFDGRGASEAMLSDHSFLQLQAGAKAVLAFGPDGPIGRRHRLLSRLDLGWLATADFRELPPDYRFFTGGDQTVRGFDYQTIGGEDENGEVIGGDSLAVASLEYEYRFTRSLGGALFVDVGTAGQTVREELAIGAGAGVRLRTPIGPVRVDVAWPLNEPANAIRVNLSIGPDL